MRSAGAGATCRAAGWRRRRRRRAADGCSSARARRRRRGARPHSRSEPGPARTAWHPRRHDTDSSRHSDSSRYHPVTQRRTTADSARSNTMSRSKGDMSSPRCLLTLMSTLNFLAFSFGGPLGPLPNVTSTDMGLKEGSCSVGDMLYLPGDEFPGSGPCERCACRLDGVHCAQVQCEPRPGCKALHRPDHCCPTYQCECEQEGRVYGNGEKLVDPHDPCRVCYCQGGEVVCRRIACFVRDDCTPRLVPGRCCPEYDSCPLRGVTSVPDMTPAASISPVKLVESVVPVLSKDDAPKITIKEITPVSEIPIITDVKIKEILPSPSIEVAEYSSSKSPLITREATSERSSNAELTKPEPEVPSVIEIHSTETTSPEVKPADVHKESDAPPSKISFSTQDSLNSEIYPSHVPIVATMGVPVPIGNSPVPAASTTKAPVIEEEDPSLFVDHNPAFPPLPDDLSVLSNHGDELVPEPSADADHIPVDNAPTPEVIVASVNPASEAESKELLTTTPKYFPDTTLTTTDKSSEITSETSTLKLEVTSTTEASIVKENPTVKLRSAIPTETVAASMVEARTSQEVSTSTTVASETLPTETSTRPAATTVTSTTTAATTVTSTTTEANEPTTIVVSDATTHEPSSTPLLIQESKSIEDMSIEVPAKPKNIEEITTEEPKNYKKLEAYSDNASVLITSEEYTTDEPGIPIEKASSSFELDTTIRPTDAPTTSTQQSSTTPLEQTTDSIAKSNVATEVPSQTELSSLPIETSDQNPHEASEIVSKETPDVSSVDPLTTTDKLISPSTKVITVSKTTENGAIDNVETTEFILTSFGSSESATDAEMIKISGDSDKSAAIIDHSDRNKNALSDFIKLVSDVASMSDHTDPPVTLNPLLSTTTADPEELIPVNAGYKSKNSNFNQNSITEVPSFKSKSGTPANKQKIVEIEDDEDGSITDSPSPNDKVEPTTRRPTIDNVSDDKPPLSSDKKEIEIIQAYVPSIKRPNKVVLQEETPPAAPEYSPEATTGAPQ